jgi:O-antigen/teichoic acid export membrane protein
MMKYEAVALPKQSLWSGTGVFASGSVVLAGSLAVNFINYIFTLLLGRMLPLSEFGEAIVFLNLFTIISVPALVIAAYVSREVPLFKVRGRAEVREFLRTFRKYATGAVVVLWILFLLAVPAIAGYLGIAELKIFIFSLLIPLLAASALQAGALQGLLAYTALVRQNITGALTKLLTVVILVGTGFMVFGVLVALIVAQFIILWYGYFTVRAALRKVADSELAVHARASLETHDIRTVGRALLPVFIAILFLALFVNLDVILAKHYLSAAAAGEYGALATLGKIIIYGAGDIPMIILPLVSTALALKNGRERQLFLTTLGLTAGIAFVLVAAFYLFPHLLIGALFGERFSDLAPWLGLFSMAMAGTVLASIFINYFIAVRNLSFILPLAIGIAAKVVLISRYHDSIGTIAVAVTASAFLLLTMLAINYLIFCRPRYGERFSGVIQSQTI